MRWRDLDGIPGVSVFDRQLSKQRHSFGTRALPRVPKSRIARASATVFPSIDGWVFRTICALSNAPVSPRQPAILDSHDLPRCPTRSEYKAQVSPKLTKFLSPPSRCHILSCFLYEKHMSIIKWMPTQCNDWEAKSTLGGCKVCTMTTNQVILIQVILETDMLKQSTSMTWWHPLLAAPR